MRTIVDDGKNLYGGRRGSAVDFRVLIAADKAAALDDSILQV